MKGISLFVVLVAGLLSGIGPVLAGDLPLRGINLSGAELNADRLPGRLFFDYVYPTTDELDRAAKQGMTVIRLPVLWERLQPKLSAALDPAELGHLRQIIEAARVRKLSVIVDLHDFGAYRAMKVGSGALPESVFAEFWARMAREFRSDHSVIFGLMNEPNGIEAAAWFHAAQAALTAIRAAGFRDLVLVPGTGWDGAHNFVSGAGYGASNGSVLAGLVDPAHAMAFEVHQYLDDYYSGTHPDCPAAAKAAALLEPFTAWLRANGAHGFLGEFGVSGRAECLSGLKAMLSHMAGNSNVWLGWTYWAAGPWWSPDYMFSAEPVGSAERPQVAVLRLFLTSMTAAR